MAWLVPKKYGYGWGGDDYSDFVWHFGRCHTSMLREINARHDYEAAAAGILPTPAIILPSSFGG